MLRSTLRFDFLHATGALLFGLLGCSSDSPSSAKTCSNDAQCQPFGLTCDEPSAHCVPAATPTAGTGGATTAGASPGGAAGISVGGALLSAGAGSGGLAQAGSAGAGVPASGSGGAAGANTAGAPAAGQSGLGGQGTGGSGGLASGGTAGSAGSGGMGMAGVMNPPGQCTTTYQGFTNYNNNGSVTYYTFNMGTGNNVHCSYGIQGRNPDTVAHVYTGSGKYFAAMNTQDYKSAAACGSCVEVSGSDGRKVTVTIVDECPIGTNPKCTAGHLDLSHEAFRQIASDNEGHVGTGHGGCCRQISWKYVPCPVPANQDVTFRLKEPDNEYYTTVVVQDHRFPIQSLQIKGMNATRQSDNFWIVGDGNQSPGPWHVRAVDVNNWIYEGTLSAGQGSDVSSGSHAVCQ